MNKNYNKWFLTKVKKVIKDYNLIEHGDKIAVGVSGGKDSTALLYILNLYRKHSPYKFMMEAIHISMGLTADITPLKEFCETLDIPLKIIETDIAQILFDIRREKNPCSLCSKLRHGALNSYAKDNGFNKVALGHHLDDVIETYFMNIIFTGQMGTFLPKTYLDRTDLTLIRPLVYIPENVTINLGKLESLPEVKSPCPYNGKTKREEVGEIVQGLVEKYPDFYEKFLTALQNVDIEHLWKQKKP